MDEVKKLKENFDKYLEEYYMDDSNINNMTLFRNRCQRIMQKINKKGYPKNIFYIEVTKHFIMVDFRVKQYRQGEMI